MHSESLNAAVLQLLRERGYNYIVAIPAKTRFYRHRQIDGLHHRAGYFQHLGYIPEHTGSGSLAGYFLHRTAEIDVDYIWLGLGNYAGGLHHKLYLASVNLNSCRALSFGYVQLARSRGYIAHQSIGRHKLGICHIGTLLLADEPERGVRHILHRREHHRALAQIHCSYLHALIIWLQKYIKYGAYRSGSVISSNLEGVS